MMGDLSDSAKLRLDPHWRRDRRVKARALADNSASLTNRNVGLDGLAWVEAVEHLEACAQVTDELLREVRTLAHKRHNPEFHPPGILEDKCSGQICDLITKHFEEDSDA